MVVTLKNLRNMSTWRFLEAQVRMRILMSIEWQAHQMPIHLYMLLHHRHLPLRRSGRMVQIPQCPQGISYMRNVFFIFSSYIGNNVFLFFLFFFTRHSRPNLVGFVEILPSKLYIKGDISWCKKDKKFF